MGSKMPQLRQEVRCAGVTESSTRLAGVWQPRSDRSREAGSQLRGMPSCERDSSQIRRQASRAPAST